ncbi:MAG TPA: hypothetical protein G4O11_12810 [Anaerolineae bacterium]|nr:hypothetical protein [Anaerolineae bacterium]
MKGKKRLSHMIGMTWVTLLLMVACRTPQPSPTATPAPTPTAEMPEWDYVAMGESITMGMTARYAEMLEQDLGVKIDLHDWQIPGDRSSSLLERLRTNEQLRRDLREAQVITFDIPLGVLAGPMQTFERGDPGACGGVDNQDCLREAFATYMADTDEIIAEIVSLRSPSEALIRMQDTWQIKVGETQESGSFEIFNGYWREANAHVVEVATSYDIPVARVYDAFMGEGGMENPRDQGLLQSDGIHPTLEGSTLVAELFRELGYEYAPGTP